MKKLIAICLILLMVTASASAAEWEDGLGPNQPYQNTPPVNFDETIGYMMYHPNNTMSVAGNNLLFIYLPRDDVKAGSRYLTLRSADQGEEFRVAMNDTQYVTERPMEEGELDMLMWGSGTCMEIRLPVSLRVGTTYYVDMEDNCIVDEARKIANNAVTSTDTVGWFFTTIADYGVSAQEYRRPTEEGEYESGIIATQAGDEVRFDLVLGGDAKSASILPYGDVQFDVSFFTESCEVIGNVTGENPDWEIIFWDVETPPMPDEMDDHIVDWMAF